MKKKEKKMRKKKRKRIKRRAEFLFNSALSEFTSVVVTKDDM